MAPAIEQFQTAAAAGTLEGVFSDIPDELYNDPEFPGLRSGWLKILMDKNFDALTRARAEKSEKGAFRFGRAFHSYLEGVPLNTVFTKYKLNRDELEALKQMRISALSREAVFTLNQNAMKEHTFIAKHPDTGVLLRCRCDLWSPSLNVIGDYKTCVDASPLGFKKAYRRFGYRVSAAFYLYVVKLVTGRWPEKFVMIAVEKEGFYHALEHEVYTEDLLETDIFQRIEEAIVRYKIGLDGGHRGYSTTPNRFK